MIKKPQKKILGTNRKTYLKTVVLCGLIFIILVFGFSLKAEDPIMNCPLNKTVTVGGLTDQSYISISNLLAEVDNVLTYSAQADITATTLIQTINTGCQPSNCESSCVTEPKCPGNECCATGYSCNYQSIKKGDEIGESVYSCANLNHFTPDDNLYYTEFIIDPPPCTNPPCSTDLCYCPCVLECKPKACGQDGWACPFTLINGLVGTIKDNRVKVEAAHLKIKDFFEKEITKFPRPDVGLDNYTIFGNFCEHYLLSKLCKKCFGVQLVLINACKSEFYALMAIQNKAINNIKKCDIINMDDLIQGKQGESLFRCKDVSPSPLRQCWPNDFFCCSAEE